MAKIPKIICICGSTRFIEKMAVLSWELEKEGNIVIGMHLLPINYLDKNALDITDNVAESQGVKKDIDELHLRKIDLAHEILVVNIDGYIGDSTRSEIEYAEKIGKPVRFLEKQNG